LTDHGLAGEDGLLGVTEETWVAGWIALHLSVLRVMHNHVFQQRLARVALKDTCLEVVPEATCLMHVRSEARFLVHSFYVFIGCLVQPHDLDVVPLQKHDQQVYHDNEHD